MDNNLNNIKKEIENFYNIANSTNKSLDKESAEQKSAKLITLLVKIEKELATIENITEKIWDNAYKNNNEYIKQKASERLDSIKTLRIKITKARLNLNYTFI